LIPIKALPGDGSHRFRATRPVGGIMSATDTLIIVVIVAAFIGFAGVLAWGDFRTRGIKPH
jgi:hypothetical protein